VPAVQVKLGAKYLNCVDVPLNPTHFVSFYIYKKRAKTFCTRNP